VSLYSAEDGPTRDVTLGAGVWNSIHSEETLAADSPKSVYETDWYPLLSVGFANGLTLTTTYYFYTSPNDAFDTIEELNFTLEWDDSEVFDFPLAPWVNVAIETKLTSLGETRAPGSSSVSSPSCSSSRTACRFRSRSRWVSRSRITTKRPTAPRTPSVM